LIECRRRRELVTMDEIKKRERKRVGITARTRSWE